MNIINPSPDHEVLPFTEAAIQSIVAGSGRCFLCGDKPSSGAGEHIFPKWLQSKLDLWDLHLTLLNGSMIPYRQLKAPCCIKCNTSVLSKIENEIVRIFKGTDSLETMVRLYLGMWLAKIFIALLVQETRMARDRSKPQHGPIVPPHFFDDFFHTHLLLQSARKRIKFECLHAEFPFSLYTYKILEDHRYGKWDFSTCIPGMSVAIRFGALGAVFVADGGLQMEVASKGPFDLIDQRLHPLQFSEISARIHYKAYLRDATHLYLTSETPDQVNMKQLNVSSFSGIIQETGEKRIFRDWDEGELAQMLCGYSGRELNKVYDSKSGRTYTTLLDSDGSLRTIPIH